MAGTISGKIIKNTAFNVLGYIWGALIAMLLTPYTVSHLGDHVYSLLVIAGILTGYFGLLDFGINTSFAKYISEFNARGEYDRVNSVVSTGFAFYFVFSAVAVAIGLGFAGEIVSALKVSAALSPDAVFAVKTGFLIFFAANVSAPFSALQRGLQRMDVSNKLSMTMALLNAVGVVTAIETGAGFRGVMTVSLLVMCLRAVGDVLVSLWIFPHFSLRKDLVGREMFLRLFHFGWKLQITKISGMVSAHMDKLLLAYFLSAGLVTAYQIGSMVAVYAVSAFTLLTNALMPAFSELSSYGDNGAAVEGYRDGTRYLGFLVSPAFVFLILCAPELISLWMGAGYERSALALQVLSAGFLVNTVLGGVGGAFVQALGRPQVQMRASLLNTFVNPALSVAMLSAFGFKGCITGTALSISIAALYFTWDLHREFKLPFRRFLISVLLFPSALSAAAAGAAFILGPCPGSFPELPEKVSLALVICARFVVFSAVYSAMVFYSKPLRSADADRIFGPGHGRLRRLAGLFCRREGGAYAA